MLSKFGYCLIILEFAADTNQFRRYVLMFLVQFVDGLAVRIEVCTLPSGP
jgi:hypothetical protein